MVLWTWKGWLAIEIVSCYARLPLKQKTYITKEILRRNECRINWHGMPFCKNLCCYILLLSYVSLKQQFWYTDLFLCQDFCPPSVEKSCLQFLGGTILILSILFANLLQLNGKLSPGEYYSWFVVLGSSLNHIEMEHYNGNGRYILLWISLSEKTDE